MSINFTKGINKILSKALKNGALDKSGMMLMNKMLDFLNLKLVNYCLNHNIANTMDVLTARNAVEEAFSGELKRHAFSEGNRYLTLYINGLVEYKPQVSVKQKVKWRKPIKIAPEELSRGILDITSVLFPEATLQDPTKRIICEMIEGLAVKFSDFIHSRRKGNITAEDVRAASMHILPQELSRHALAEAARIVFLYELGKLKEPTKKRIDEKVTTKRLRRRAEELKTKKPRVALKRKRSPSKALSRSPKRRRMPSRKKVLRKTRVPKSRLRKAVTKVLRKRPEYQKRAPPRKVRRKKRVPIKTVRRKAAKPRVIRKKVSPRKLIKKKRVARKPVDRKIIKPRVLRKPRSLPRKAAEIKPEKPRKARKRKRSPSETPSRSPKRRRKHPARKISPKRAAPKTRRRKPVSKISRKRPVHKTKTPLRKITVKKSVSKTIVPRKAAKPTVLRKKSPPRKVTRKKRVLKDTVPRKARKPRVSYKRRPVSAKRRVSRKKRTAIKTKIPPKKTRKISKKEPPKKKLLREDKGTPTVVKEINRGTKKLNELYRQKLPPETSKVIVDYLANLLDALMEEMRKSNSSIIRPEHVRQAVMKVFPPDLADLALAHMSQIIMT